MVTIQDLADSCGVSIATISRAFAPNGRISQKTKAMILKRADELGYVPNVLARSLQTRKTYAVGIIVPEITNSFYFTVIKNMEASFREKGYHLLIGFYENGVSGEAEVIENMASNMVDALIISPTNRSAEATLKKCFPSGNVLQLFTSVYREYPSLAVNDIAGTASAVEYLISKGNRRILYFGGPDRKAGYLNTVRAKGIYDPSLDHSGFYGTAEEALQILHSTEPDAVLAVAKVSEPVIAALHRDGWRIPDPIHLVVYDDVEWAGMLGITAVSHPLSTIAADACRMIMEGLHTGFSAVESTVVYPFVTERSSTAGKKS